MAFALLIMGQVVVVVSVMFFFFRRVAARSREEERKRICSILERESENAFTEYRKQANQKMRNQKVLDHYETAMGIYGRLFSQYFRDSAQ